MKKFSEKADHRNLVKESYQNKDTAKKYEGLRFNCFFGGLSSRRDIKMILNALNTYFDRKDVSVLDVACGTGRITEALAQNYPDIVGCDSSQDMIDIARGKEELSDIKFQVTDATDLPFTTSSFDCVTSVRFIGHLNESDCQLAVNEMARVARQLVVLDVCIDNPLTNLRRNLKKKIKGSYLEFETEWNWRVFTKGSLRECLGKANLKLLTKQSKLPLWSDGYVITCIPEK